MRYIEKCSIKINLNLRVLETRGDGYHELHSLFWKLESPEVLEIETGTEADFLAIEGANIEGENIVTRALHALRKQGTGPGPLVMRLSKHVPTGSGVGAGSGNAAALLRWHERMGGSALSEKELASLGADVAFLASPHNLALADGIGEKLSPLAGRLNLPCMILFPNWTSDTKKAYAQLDAAPRDIVSRAEATAASSRIIACLRDKRPAGLLPNDFISCQREVASCYNELYATFEKSGALAWGLCGSGSACFALYSTAAERDSASLCFSALPSLRKMLLME